MPRRNSTNPAGRSVVMGHHSLAWQQQPSRLPGEQFCGQSQTQDPQGQVQTSRTKYQPTPSPEYVTIEPRQHRTQCLHGQVQTIRTKYQPTPSPEYVTIELRQHQTQFPHGQVQTIRTKYHPTPSPQYVTIEPRQHQTLYQHGQHQSNRTQTNSPIFVTVEPRHHQHPHYADCRSVQYQPDPHPHGQVQTFRTQYPPPHSANFFKIQPTTHHAHRPTQALQNQPSQHPQPNPHLCYPNPGEPDTFIQDKISGRKIPMWYNPPGIVSKDMAPDAQAEYDRIRRKIIQGSSLR
ncbi:hypothetical protein MMC31_001184 [Peltigera leucophlebia]|nr:hypothetical protein [Peltigera leucophlebia]